MSDLEVNILNPSGGGPIKFMLPPSTKISEIKAKIATEHGIAVNEQRLIYGGRIMKDNDTLATYNYGSGNTIHLVKSSSNRAQEQAAHRSSPTATNPNTNTMGGMGNPMGQLGGGGGLGGLGGLGGEQPTPQQMEQMMENPMVQQMMNNPEMMREMMMANPQIRALTENNPEMRQLLNDPELLRQSMATARNPALRQQMMRNQDRAMSNIESMPGGFNMLRRLHTDIEEPMMEAMTQRPGNDNNNNTNGNNNATANNTNTNTNTNTNQTNTINSERAAKNPFINLLQPPKSAAGPPSNAPVQNPWALGTATTPPANGGGGNAAANNPFASMFGGGNTAANPMAGMGGMPNFGMPGGMPGMPGMPGGGQPNPEQMIQMLENPQMRAMMENMMSNPEMLERQLASNPALANNPQMQAQIRQMMSNPQMRQNMFNPDVIRAGLQMQQAQQTMANPGLGGNTPNTNTNTNTNTNPSATPNNPFASLFGGGQMPQMPSMAQQPAPTLESMASEIQQLRDMGFYDDQANLRALTQTSGNVSAAVDRLLQQM